MKKKYADYPNWEKVYEKNYVNKYFNNSDFKGNISLLTVVKVKEKIIDENGKVFLDDNFKWLEIYPETNKNIAVITCINDKDEILDWYFDIAKDSSLTENGVPYIDDLYLDIMLKPEEGLKILDEDELKEALNNNDISEADYNLAYKVAADITSKLNGKFEALVDFTKKYYKYMKEIK